MDKIDCKDCFYYPDICKNYKKRKHYACLDYKESLKREETKNEIN